MYNVLKSVIHNTPRVHYVAVAAGRDQAMRS